MLALVDGNNFYASVQRVFEPQLRGLPLVVLSNNDGAAIARSQEAKALGVRMAQPAFELRDLQRSHGLVMRSANFALYGDVSRRVLAVLRELTPRLYPYSIDENFCDLSGVRDREDLAHEMRRRLLRYVGIPTCVGIGPTQGLAKAANRLAKKGAGVVSLCSRAEQDEGLAALPVGDVWGVGSRWGTKLIGMGIETAAQLRDAPGDLIGERFGVVLLRTQRELQGHPCLTFQDIEPDRQQIVVSRSFGERVEDHAAVAQAIATFAVRATEKMRQRGLVTAAVSVFASTDAFRPELRQHHASRSLSLAAPTSDTRFVLGAVRQLMTNLLRQGCAYKRAGVALMDLARPASLQPDLFAPATQGDDRLMTTLDTINRRFGRGTAGMGATGWKTDPAWKMRQRSLSPCFTTRWSDVPSARC